MPRLIHCFLLALLCGIAPAQAANAPRPNFIFILVDDLRWDALGYAGHPFAKTPQLDRLAREGAVFRNNFVSIPLCSPSRASFLTGTWSFPDLPRSLPDLPRSLPDISVSPRSR